MASATTDILTNALSAVEELLREGKPVNLPALEAFNAGASVLVQVGMEPSENQKTAFANLMSMFDDTPVSSPSDAQVQSPAAPVDAGASSDEGGASSAGEPAVEAPATDTSVAATEPAAEPVAAEPAPAEEPAPASDATGA